MHSSFTFIDSLPNEIKRNLLRQYLNERESAKFESVSNFYKSVAKNDICLKYCPNLYQQSIKNSEEKDEIKNEKILGSLDWDQCKVPCQKSCWKTIYYWLLHSDMEDYFSPRLSLELESSLNELIEVQVSELLNYVKSRGISLMHLRPEAYSESRVLREKNKAILEKFLQPWKSRIIELSPYSDDDIFFKVSDNIASEILCKLLYQSKSCKLTVNNGDRYKSWMKDEDVGRTKQLNRLAQTCKMLFAIKGDDFPIFLQYNDKLDKIDIAELETLLVLYPQLQILKSVKETPIE